MAPTKKTESDYRSSIKIYTRESVKVRREWEFHEHAKKAAQAAGSDSTNGFLIQAIVEAATYHGVTFDKGPFLNIDKYTPEARFLLVAEEVSGSQSTHWFTTADELRVYCAQHDGLKVITAREVCWCRDVDLNPDAGQTDAADME